LNAVHSANFGPTVIAASTVNATTATVDTPVAAAQTPVTTGPTSLLSAAEQQAASDHLFHVHAASLTGDQGNAGDVPAEPAPVQPDESEKNKKAAPAAPATPNGNLPQSRLDANTVDHFWSTKTTNTSEDASAISATSESLSPLAAVVVLLGGYQIAPEMAAEEDRKPRF
jgi:hypothetical protein